jgi:hypothetical protein
MVSKYYVNTLKERDNFEDPVVKEHLQILKLKHSLNFEDITWIACLKVNSQQKGTNYHKQGLFHSLMELSPS